MAFHVRQKLFFFFPIARRELPFVIELFEQIILFGPALEKPASKFFLIVEWEVVYGEPTPVEVD